MTNGKWQTTNDMNHSQVRWARQMKRLSTIKTLERTTTPYNLE
jgi:hypothetical protein